jgi:hypothetical protein
MKRILALSLALIVAAGLLFAQESSLALASSGTYSKYSETAITAYEQASPALTLPLGKDAEISVKGHVKYSYDQSMGELDLGDLSDLSKYSYGLGELRLESVAKKPSADMKSYVFDVGRMDYGDPSGYVLSTPADGLAFRFMYPSCEFAFDAAYTGLLFSDDDEIVMSLADAARQGSSSEFFGSPRYIMQFGVSFPDILGQSISLAALSQSDLNPSSSFVAEGSTSYEIGKGGRLNTQYFELKSSGSLKAASYEGVFIYGTGRTLSWMADSASLTGYSYQYMPMSTFLASLRLDMPFSFGSFGLHALYASGDKDTTSLTEGNASAVYKCFTPINSPSLGVVFSPNLANIALGEASLALTPLIGSIRLNGVLKAIAFFRPTTGPISEPGIDSSSTNPYLGSEADLSLSIGLLSDLGISCVIGAFLPGSAFASSYQAVQYSACLTATITM